MRDKIGIEDVIKNIMAVLLVSEEKENLSRYEEVIKSVINSGYNFEDMDNFSVLINYQLKKILAQVVFFVNSNSISESVDQDKLVFLYLNYDFMENHIRNLIVSKEGSCCCADKTSWILEKYRNYILTGQKIDLGTEIKFWMPGFGEFSDWMRYCDSLYSLFHGGPREYMAAYTSLLEKKSRIY